MTKADINGEREMACTKTAQGTGEEGCEMRRVDDDNADRKLVVKIGGGCALNARLRSFTATATNQEKGS
jgi:hypothetical protein